MNDGAETAVDDASTTLNGASAAARPQEQEFRERFDIPQDVAIEDYARELGWRPQEEFRDDPSKWRSADQFIEYGQRNHVVLKENFRKVQEKNLKMERELSELRGVAKDFTEFMDGTKKAINERKRENLLNEKVSALENGDHRRAIAIDEELRRAEVAATGEPAPKAPAADHPIVTQYRRDNPWYGSDLEMTAEADEVGERLIRTAQGMGQQPDPEGILKSVINVMKRRYPEKFSKGGAAPDAQMERDQRGGTANGSSFTTTAGVGGRGSKPAPIYSSLPADAKKKADMFIEKRLIPNVNYKDQKDVQRAKDAIAKRFFDAYPNGKIPENAA